MRFVLDTNVILDAFLGRKPFDEPALLLLQLGYVGEFELWIGSSQISDLTYILTEGGKPSLAPYCRNVLERLCRIAHIYSTCQDDVLAIAHSTWDDLEDALVYQTAAQVRADAIITRDATGFVRSPIPIFDCAALFAHLKETRGLDYAFERF